MHDGNVDYNPECNTVYLFHNLIANFSDTLFPYNNKTFDRTEEYIQPAQRAVYPPFYQSIESEHKEKVYDLLSVGKYNMDGLQKERNIYLELLKI